MYGELLLHQLSPLTAQVPIDFTAPLLQRMGKMWLAAAVEVQVVLKIPDSCTEGPLMILLLRGMSGPPMQIGLLRNHAIMMLIMRSL